MKREMVLNLAGKDYDLVGNWKSSLDIAQQVMDPLVMMRDAALSLHFAENNVPYESRFEFTIESTVRILHCALRANGHDLTLDDVGEAVVADGIIDHVANSEKFIRLLVSNGSKEVEGGKPTGK